jgi:predicted membrane protein
MKMGALSFWGILLILIGLSLVVKTVFNLDFSVFRIAIAFVFIYIGIKLFVGKHFEFFKEDKKQIVFGEQKVDYVNDKDEFNVIFSGATFNLQNMQFPKGETIRFKINTVLGGTEIMVPEGLAVKVKSNTVFGGTEMPNGNTSAFGEIKYESDSCKTSEPVLIIETNTVFGGVQIKTKHIQPNDTLTHF